jgi:gamma-glutamyltranspeptidase / glutathione hydrolase
MGTPLYFQFGRTVFIARLSLFLWRSGIIKIMSPHLLSASTAVLTLLLLQGAGPAPPSYRSGMVAAAHPMATRIGVDVLKQGGNAIDAAVATAFTLGVVEPNASGIGGGGFMVIYLAKTRQVITIDFREKAPLTATPGMYQDASGRILAERMKEGHEAVATPGSLAGLAYALSHYGTITLPRALKPAIDVAEYGFQITPLLGSMIANSAAKLAKFPASAEIYLKPGGRPFKTGEKLTLKDLAKTYRLISEQGIDIFYRGSLAGAIEREMKRAGKGLLTRQDLALYKPALRQPVQGTYRGYDVFSMAPPSSGGTHVLEILNVLEGYDISALGVNSADTIRLMADTMMQVFADRTKWMGDPDFVEVPVKTLLSSEHTLHIRKEIEKGGLPSASGKPTSSGTDQTTHISVADREGNLVALTQTINSFFGSGVVVPGTGILLNNEMNDFDPKPGGPNSIAPGKRPVSSMSPSIVLKDGRPFLTIGMPGATRIITALPQVIMNVIDHGMTLQSAIDSPRVHCTSDKEIAMEARIPGSVRESLARKGYRIEVKKDFDLYFGGAQGVMIDSSGVLTGGADPRRDGSVAGY